ncbi:MAG: alpha-L-fucosidase [Acidobacteria bacterium]|nr:MAG: alpha-L-fucosidase [Acidobacteriota bacterium]
MRAFWLKSLPLLLLLAANPVLGGDRYKPDWQSLATHQNPEWLIDGKFGIYAHWGVYSVPAHVSEWYGRLMHDRQDPRSAYDFHIKTFGPLDRFGYKDFISLFRAEKFNADEWSDLIQQSGARYAGIAVIHHDGFALWQSKVNRWNSAEMGPKRDLYGELVKALRARGLKIVATEHHMRTFNWYLPPDRKSRDELRQAGVDLFDPKYADFYWNEYTSKKSDFIDQWKAKIQELIDTYRPDVLWFDGGDYTSPEVGGAVLGALAHYYNHAAERRVEVEVLNKFAGRKFNFPREFGILTFEEGRDRPDLVDRPWIDDQRIGHNAWGYVEGLKIKTPAEIVRGFVDRVSRGGGLLLSLSPKADGEIPEDQKIVLREMGQWLKVNGEAIYGSRAWDVHAEGSTEKLTYTDQNGSRRWRFDGCTPEDIRFTVKGRTLYAIALGWPANGELTIKTLAKGNAHLPGIAAVTLVGSSTPVKWSETEQGLIVRLPAEKPCKYAYTLKITPKPLSR